jgi:DNA-binding NarL/FixJ family response regulator
VITLLIADDHPVVRDGLRGMFTGDPEFTVLGEAADGTEAVTLAENLRPDVILMDLRMPGTGGVSAIKRLHERGVPARVLVLTTYDTDGDVLTAIEAGATGYLLKDAPRGELIRAVQAAARGEAVLSSCNPATPAAPASRAGRPYSAPSSRSMARTSSASGWSSSSRMIRACRQASRAAPRSPAPW